ncbi:MAG: hypothetical protein P8Z71_12500, partial [Candidatus Sulfobium sp.]
VYAPSISTDNFLIKPDLSLQPLSAGLVKWKTNTSGPIDESLYGDIPINDLPSGIYYLGLLVTPVDKLNDYYFWVTSFSVP